MIVWELSTTGPTNRTVPTIIIDYAICTEVLYKTSGSWIRICDIVLLAPNAMFMVFLFYSLGLAHAKLVGTRCPIVKTIYTLVFAVCVVSVARCFASMLLTASFVKSHEDSKTIKAFWLLLRCLLLSVELSVIIFGVCAANLDSRSSVRRVLLFTSASAVLFTSAQAVLEFTQDGIHSPYGGTYNLFQHGGMIFWFASSMLFFVMYFSLLILPCISFGRRLRLPGKPSFYRYCGFLALINILQSIGSALIYYHITFGTCILDVTVFTYFALFAPLVYVTFLAEFMSSTLVLQMASSNISYSYQPIPDSIATQETERLPAKPTYGTYT
ncbi:transmembrane protein adipocyte-associated 1 isoform X2 [Nematostella vectensis]|uniref:transmembrane protein adipocyte-associated 1 isoform X2 n=1 Tax=Nematostella vectensis TaxID=45351 RepID=UPI002077275E|nr:transmembrane protein adipocyte-associated 1 isoform X2 [Nematostella vectensis]